VASHQTPRSRHTRAQQRPGRRHPPPWLGTMTVSRAEPTRRSRRPNHSLRPAAFPSLAVGTEYFIAAREEHSPEQDARAKPRSPRACTSAVLLTREGLQQPTPTARDAHGWARTPSPLSAREHTRRVLGRVSRSRCLRSINIGTVLPSGTDTCCRQATPTSAGESARPGRSFRRQRDRATRGGGRMKQSCPQRHHARDWANECTSGLRTRGFPSSDLWARTRAADLSYYPVGTARRRPEQIRVAPAPRQVRVPPGRR
jgi:hypothetical protein